MSDHVAPALEAILLVAEEPLPAELLAKLVGTSVSDVEELCESLAAEYVADGRGFVLTRVAGGYRYQTATEQAPYVERFVLDGQSARLSAAALETLAVVAYKQPVSRNQIAQIRGVNVDGVMRTLQQRGYIDEVARDPGPGQAVLYGTTPTFLERLGLDSIDELPPLGEFFPDTDVVEALERGLRVGPDDDAEPADAERDTGGDEQGGSVLPDGSDDAASDEEQGGSVLPDGSDDAASDEEQGGSVLPDGSDDAASDEEQGGSVLPDGSNQQ